MSTPSFDNEPNAIACHPSFPGLVWVGTDKGGVWRGQFDIANKTWTWTPMGTMTDGTTTYNKILSITLDSHNPLWLWAGTDLGRVFRSQDSGVIWSFFGNGLPERASVYSLALDPGTTGPSAVLWAGTGGGGIYRTRNAGGLWEPKNAGVPVGLINALALDPSDPSYQYASVYGSGVWRTDNARDTNPSWSNFSAGLASISNGLYLRSLSLDPNTTGGHPTLYAGTNGGGVVKYPEDPQNDLSWMNFSAGVIGLYDSAPVSLALDGTTARLLAGTSARGLWATCTPCDFKGGASVVPTGLVGVPIAFSLALGSDCASFPRFAYTYAWDFGDGGASALASPSHAYAVPGTYTWSVAVTLIDTVAALRCGSGTVTHTYGHTITIEPPCTLTCTAEAPAADNPGSAVNFSATATPSSCAGAPTFEWAFGDGGTSTEPSPCHIYAGAGIYAWSLTARVDGASCAKSGNIAISNPSLPGDCDGSGEVSIGEVQKAINMFLGLLSPDCGVDCNGDGSVSIGEVQKGINGFLGLASSCTAVVACSSPPGLVIAPVPQINLGAVSGAPGSAVAVPVTLAANGASVPAVSYRASYNPALLAFTGATPGPAGSAAGKQAVFSVNSQTRVITLGVLAQGNRTPLQDGVIAYLNFTIQPGAAALATLTGPCGASDPDGNDLSCACAGGSVRPTGPYSITGRVTQGTPATGISGIQMTLRGWASTATTDAQGYYSFDSLVGGCTYTVVPPLVRCKRFNYPYLNVPVPPSGAANFSASAVGLCLPCFDTLDADLRRCDFDLLCMDRARVSFSSCLREATLDAGSVLYDATLAAIAVTRVTGPPMPVTVPFSIASEGDYSFNLTNGDQVNKETMVSSATIGITPGGEVYGPGDLNKNVAFLSRPVHLTPGDYTLTTEVRSQPGAYVALVVSNLDFGELP